LTRTRRIEVIRYRRRITLNGGLKPDQCDDLAKETVREVLSLVFPTPELLQDELRVSPAASARTRFLRRLLKAGAVFCRPSRHSTTKVK
jgi:hypothetical protein